MLYCDDPVDSVDLPITQSKLFILKPIPLIADHEPKQVNPEHQTGHLSPDRNFFHRLLNKLSATTSLHVGIQGPVKIGLFRYSPVPTHTMQRITTDPNTEPPICIRLTICPSIT